MFTQSAIIENTKEARDWLNSLGYTNEKGAGQEYIVTYSPSAVYFIINDNYPSFRTALNKEKAIDCQGNLQLFKAITALRDGSDYMQWFYSTGWKDYAGRNIPDKWTLCEHPTLKQHGEVNNSPNSYSGKYIEWHKATAEELIEHFKQKI